MVLREGVAIPTQNYGPQRDAGVIKSFGNVHRILSYCCAYSTYLWVVLPFRAISSRCWDLAQSHLLPRGMVCLWWGPWGSWGLLQGG